MDSIFWVILAIVVAVLAAFFIPILIQIKKMIGSITDFINTTNDGVKPLMGEVTDTVKRANSIVGTVDETLKDVLVVASALKELGPGLKKLGSTLMDSAEYLGNLKEQLKGAGSALKNIFSALSRSLKKKEDS